MRKPLTGSGFLLGERFGRSLCLAIEPADPAGRWIYCLEEVRLYVACFSFAHSLNASASSGDRDLALLRCVDCRALEVGAFGVDAMVSV